MLLLHSNIAAAASAAVEVVGISISISSISSSIAAAAAVEVVIDGCALWQNARSASENNMKRRVDVAYHAQNHVHEWNFIGFGCSRGSGLAEGLRGRREGLGWGLAAYFWLACASLPLPENWQTGG